MALTRVSGNLISSGTITSNSLSTTGVTSGVYGGSSAIPIITVDSGGRVTNAVNVALSSTSNTANNLAAGSAGTIPYQTGSGSTAMLATGTAGQVLTSNGTNAPTWSTPAAGSMTLLQTVTGSGVTEIDVTGNFTATYKFYKMYVSVASSSYPQIYVRLFINGSLVSDSAYAYTASYAAPGQSNWPVNYASGTNYISTYISGKSLNFEFTFFDPSNVNHRNAFWYLGNSADESPTQTTYGTAGYMATGTAGTRAMTGIKLTSFGTSVTSWSAKLYGIKET